MSPIRPQRQALSCIAGLASVLSVGCGEHPSTIPPRPAPVSRPAEASKPPAPREGKQIYTLRGVVKSVSPDKGEVKIAHETIPGFMEAMVMPFGLKKRELFADLQPGDIVEGPLVVVYRAGQVEDYELTDLTVTGSVPLEPPPPLARPTPLAVGAEVPDFTVTTQVGTTLRLSELRGKVVALTFIYTRCPLPDFCPAVDLKFADLARLVTISRERANQVVLLSVSFDPKHDTPGVLAAHARRRGAKPPWTFAVASTDELAKVGPLLGLDYYPERDEFAHNLSTAVIGPDGRLARLELGRGWTPADLFKTILSLIPVRGSH